jgi:ABC-type antimicrobial peptide transport system permease subunit
VCLAGQQIPASTVHIPTPPQQFEWLGVVPGSGQNSGVVVAGAYEHLALLSSHQPVSYRFVIVTGRPADQSGQIQDSLNASFQTPMVVYGIPSQEALFSVTRLDSAEAIRSAANGVDMVYSFIAWGILILGGLGLLVAEMIVVKDRNWFFGLSRAVGGTGTDIAVLIIADTVLVLMAGTVVALLFALILQPFAASFAESAFQISDVKFLHASTVPQLIIGEFLVLLLAGAYPAARAVRQDPLDVLEPRVS